MDNTYYVRLKSSLTKKKFKRHPAFEQSRLRSIQFGHASKLASAVYRTLPKEKRAHGLIGKLTGLVNGFLQEGCTLEEAKARLELYCFPKKAMSRSKSNLKCSKLIPVHTSCLKAGLKLYAIEKLAVFYIPNSSNKISKTRKRKQLSDRKKAHRKTGASDILLLSG